jgi:hypothetical protein
MFFLTCSWFLHVFSSVFHTLRLLIQAAQSQVLSRAENLDELLQERLEEVSWREVLHALVCNHVVPQPYSEHSD